jgi:hypothetical protein
LGKERASLNWGQENGRPLKAIKHTQKFLDNRKEASLVRATIEDPRKRLAGLKGSGDTVLQVP